MRAGMRIVAYLGFWLDAILHGSDFPAKTIFTLAPKWVPIKAANNFTPFRFMAATVFGT